MKMNDELNKNTSLFTWLSSLMLNKDKPEGIEMLREQLGEATREGVLNSEALQMIEGILKVNELRVKDIMIPRPEMNTVDVHASLEHILEIIEEKQHSRYPVLEGDEPVGVLFAKDLLPNLHAKPKEWNMKKVVRTIRSVPESQRLNFLLKDFRDSRQHMAIVLDEHSELVGLITIEDVLEQIVGEINDEHDALGEMLIINHGKQYSIKGLTPLTDMRERFKVPFESDSDTLAGLLLERFEHLPEKGEKIHIDGYSFRVLQIDERRIQLVSVKPLRETE